MARPHQGKTAQRESGDVLTAKTYLEPPEIERMEQAASCVRDGLLVRCLFRLGARISEVLALRVQDIDFPQGLVRIEQLKIRVNRSCQECGMRLAKNHLFCPGCGKPAQPKRQEVSRRRRRLLPLDSGTLELLRGYLQRTGIKSGPIFISTTTKGALDRKSGWRIVRGCARHAEVGPLLNPDTGHPRGASPHRLRDAFAVLAVKKDDSADALRLLQEHLGHQSFDTTARYRKVAGEEHKEWYERLWEEETP